jgi:hypothetical protein
MAGRALSPQVSCVAGAANAEWITEMRATGGLLALALAAGLAAPAFAADRAVRILFVGNSYTFGRVDPVLSYNAAAVHDLTAGFNAANPAGTNSHPAGAPGLGSFEPHPWGGVPGIFKKLTDEAGLNYDVSLSTRNATSLRGHFLDLANADWKLRENVAMQTWDAVVLQELSDAALPPGQGKNANLAAFNAYADQFERFIHGGAANPHASAATRVWLEQGWARPDMVEAHKITRPDITSHEGRPVVDTSRTGGDARLYYASLAGMTADLHEAFYAKAAANPGFAGVVPVGDAFQRAVDQGLAQGSGFYGADGTLAETAGVLNLWWLDRTHASKYGSYLAALTLFGRLTGRDPLSLGASEQAAVDLGIEAATAQALQRVASEQLGFADDTIKTGKLPGSAPAR